MSKKPEWANAKVKMYLATCWADLDENNTMLQGVHFWDDWLLFFCVFIHNFFVAPFCPENEGFPMHVIETYPVVECIPPVDYKRRLKE